MAKYLEEAYRYMARTFSWERSNTSLTMRMNEFSTYDFQKIFSQNGTRIVGQGVDNLGKTQLLVLFVPSLQKEVVIGVPPSEPLINDDSDNGYIPILTFMPDITTTYAEALQLFSPLTPTAVTRDENNLVETVWFPLGDIPSAIYVHIVPTRTNFSSSLNNSGERFPFRLPSPEHNNILQEYRLLSKTAQFIQQLVEYLFLKDNQQKNYFG